MRKMSSVTHSEHLWANVADDTHNDPRFWTPTRDLTGLWPVDALQRSLPLSLRVQDNTQYPRANFQPYPCLGSVCCTAISTRTTGIGNNSANCLLDEPCAHLSGTLVRNDLSLGHYG